MLNDNVFKPSNKLFIMDGKLLGKVEELVKLEYDKLTCWAHGWLHIRKVERNAEELAKIIGIDPFVCGIAAYCHDLGRVVEEETSGKETALGNIDHSLFSVEPTTLLLQKVGINGYNFSSIVGAVTVHSDKLYYGKNLVAKVLRDCDKKDSLGPFGTLRHVRHHFNVDFVDTYDIMKYQDDYEQIERLANETLKVIKLSEETKTKYLKVLDFVLEWVDNKMLDLNESYDFLNKHYQYTKHSKEFLLS